MSHQATCPEFSQPLVVSSSVQSACFHACCEISNMPTKSHQTLSSPPQICWTSQGAAGLSLYCKEQVGQLLALLGVCFNPELLLPFTGFTMDPIPKCYIPEKCFHPLQEVMDGVNRAVWCLGNLGSHPWLELLQHLHPSVIPPPCPCPLPQGSSQQAQTPSPPPPAVKGTC